MLAEFYLKLEVYVVASPVTIDHSENPTLLGPRKPGLRGQQNHSGARARRCSTFSREDGIAPKRRIHVVSFPTLSCSTANEIAVVTDCEVMCPLVVGYCTSYSYH
jgi:hypothetical protein